MRRYRTEAPLDDVGQEEGDDSLYGVDSYQTAENLPPGMTQAATNVDFSTFDAATRGGFVCIPELGNAPFDAASLWTTRTAPNSASRRAVAYGNGVFVAVGSAGINKPLYSSDAETWSEGTWPLGSTATWCAVAYGNGVFVAVANSLDLVNVMTSVDGITWTGVSSGLAFSWVSVAYGNGIFAAASSDSSGRIMTSSDNGITWTQQFGSPALGYTGIAFGGGVFVAVANSVGGAGARAAYSTNLTGTTWSLSATPGSGAWLAVTFGSATFVAVSDTPYGEVMTSLDGSSWTLRTAAGTNAWSGIAYGNSLFVAVGTNAVMTSPNGVSWTSQTPASASAWNGIVNGRNTFVAVATNASVGNIMTSGATSSVWGCGTFSDPNNIGSQYIMVVGTDRVGFYAFGKTSHIVNIVAGQTVSELCTVLQANNKVFIFRGDSETPLVWDGVWGDEFQLATGTIVDSDMAVFVQNRLWVKNGKDTISASDVLDFTTFNALDNSVNIGKGDSTYLVTLFPFGDTTLIAFKNRSIIALTNIDGSLSDIVATELTRQVGAIGINSVCSVGPDLVYVSDRNINLLSLTQTNNALQLKTLPLSTPIKKIFDRVNWNYGYKISLGYWDNKIYVALPLDNATVCSSVVVYNFVTEKWYGEWNFSADLGMSILGWQVANYLGLQRLHAVTEDGRIFVTDEGPMDVSGTNIFEIASSVTTRPYKTDNNQKLTRRFWMDIGTWRPTFSVVTHTSGEGYERATVTDRTYARSESYLFNDSAYALNNSNDDYNRPWRKDYASYPGDSVQPQSGYNPNVLQETRLPVVVRVKGRLVYFTVSNSTGKLSLNGIGLEAIPGDRQSYPQVG